jgi:enediyne biosynthesis protein E4
MGVAWGDYDADGDLDVYVTSTGDWVGALYQNTGVGTFVRSTASPIATDTHHGAGCAWADFDNDGGLDLFVADWETSSRLYLNNNGALTASLYEAGRRSLGVVWGDYDNDGYLDLFLPSGGFERFSTTRPDILYHNDGNGRLLRAPASVAGAVVETAESGIAAAWSDLDGDGLLDLFVVNHGQPNSLFLNTPAHQFVRVTEGSLVHDISNSSSCALGDYDNDGDVDIFVANGSSYPTQDQGQLNFIYRNDGGGKFSKIMDGPVATDIGQSLGAAWADYDNDGWLDLFVANGESLDQDNFLYRNNGDGTFSRVLEGSPAKDGGYSVSCAWGDYDNDGFLDLIVANGALRIEPQVNFLYRNGGNGNHWIRVKCVGTTSNRSGIGAKVRARATIGGKTFWQLREINSGNGFCGNAIDAHFGLGDAEKVDVLRVEWPSGIVQELRDLAAGQFMTLLEPPRLESLAAGQLRLHGWRGQEFHIESSTDLRQWSPFQTVTSIDSTGVVPVTDAGVKGVIQQFYRTASRPKLGE